MYFKTDLLFEINPKLQILDCFKKTCINKKYIYMLYMLCYT